MWKLLDARAFAQLPSPWIQIARGWTGTRFQGTEWIRQSEEWTYDPTAHSVLPASAITGNAIQIGNHAFRNMAVIGMLSSLWTWRDRLWCKWESGVNGAFLSLYWKEVLVLTRPERVAKCPASMLLVRPAC
jgi:hypothetical protein